MLSCFGAFQETNLLFVLSSSLHTTSPEEWSGSFPPISENKLHNSLPLKHLRGPGGRQHLGFHCHGIRAERESEALFGTPPPILLGSLLFLGVNSKDKLFL